MPETTSPASPSLPNQDTQEQTQEQTPQDNNTPTTSSHHDTAPSDPSEEITALREQISALEAQLQRCEDDIAWFEERESAFNAYIEGLEAELREREEALDAVGLLDF
ncbi:hypothetical protein P153DRAFT_382410 [Dothidotthia symphoricarpi CBS 119687]|uniref:Uncharacterized protein n=1 Tax=Dothidotthia symphoricarpi CBS 119687 TaxID=1392245 RepID=A0A6A6AP05_9PLEO|nr:uncharacterized protein P153DRAFT_382410 [Dothidotthia symphoricarpi CBS 119687]KAF2132785.1 hypothetical protein P153DRAFT_382410 [Dothidotthia symphoricarpi CBS 119687]